MKTKSILIPAAALIAGSVAGWFTGESPRAAAASAQSQAVPPPEIAATQNAAPAVKPRRFDALYDHLVWLESATASKVGLHLWAQDNNNDPALRALTVSRFLRFSASERLDALMAINPGTEFWYRGDEDTWLRPTVTEMIARAPEQVASVLAASRIPMKVEGLLDPLFAAAGYDGCLALIKLMPREESQYVLRAAALGLLARQDVARAQTESLNQPEGKVRNQMVLAVSQAWADSDPRAAMAWAVQHARNLDDSQGGGNHPARSLLAELLLKDSKLGGELLLEHQIVFHKSQGPQYLSQAFGSWAEKDYQGAADWLAANPLGDDIHTTAARAVSSTRLKTLKGTEALQFYQSLPGDIKGDCSRALLQAVGVDGLPGGLVGFTESLPESERLSFLSNLRSVETRLTPEQIKAVMPLVARLDTSGYTARDFMSQLPEADLAAMRSLLPEKLRAEVSIHAAEKAMESGDLETAKTLLTTTEGRDTLHHAQLAIELAQNNPAEATAWIDSLKDGQTKQDAITNLAANWAKADLAAATTWVEQLPAGNARDEAVREITLLHSLTGDTAAALTLAATVKSESERITAFANAARHAWFHDAAGTSALLAARGLSAEQQQKVIAEIQTGSTR